MFGFQLGFCQKMRQEQGRNGKYSTFIPLNSSIIRKMESIFKSHDSNFYNKLIFIVLRR